MAICGGPHAAMLAHQRNQRLALKREAALVNVPGGKVAIASPAAIAGILRLGLLQFVGCDDLEGDILDVRCAAGVEVDIPTHLHGPYGQRILLAGGNLAAVHGNRGAALEHAQRPLARGIVRLPRGCKGNAQPVGAVQFGSGARTRPVEVARLQERIDFGGAPAQKAGEPLINQARLLVLTRKIALEGPALALQGADDLCAMNHSAILPQKGVDCTHSIGTHVLKRSSHGADCHGAVGTPQDDNRVRAV